MSSSVLSFCLHGCPLLLRSFQHNLQRTIQTARGGYTLVSRPFISIVQCSLLFFRCLGGIGGFFLSESGRTPSSSCMSWATSGGMNWCLTPKGGGRQLPLLVWQFITGGVLIAVLVSQIKGTCKLDNIWDYLKKSGVLRRFSLLRKPKVEKEKWSKAIEVPLLVVVVHFYF